MKAFLNFFLLIVIVSFVTSGCEKDNLTPDEDPLQPDKNALRISRISNHPALIDPLWTFEYNEDGLVTAIGGEWMRGTTSITYNDEDLPVKIQWVNDDESSTTSIIEISWTENSYTLNQEYYFENETYTLDANGFLVSIEDDYEVQWNENEVVAYYLPEGADKEWAQTRELSEYKHPLSAINLAIITACEISWIFDECDWVFQNKYSLSSNVSVDEGSADYEYEYNKDGYPTQLRIFETTEMEIHMLYFEYETD